MKVEKIINALKNDLDLIQNTTSLEFNAKLRSYISKRKIQKIKFDNVSELLNIINYSFAKELRNLFKLNNIIVVDENCYLPLKRWEERWGIPKRFKIKNNTLFGLISTRKKIKHPQLWKQYPTKVYYLKKNKNEIWVKIVNWNKYFQTEFVNERFYKIINGYLNLKIPNGYLGIGSKSKDKIQFILIKKVPIDKFFLESVGLLWGEMGKSTKGNEKRIFSFANKRPEIILYILKFLSLFDIQKNNLKIEISIYKQYEKNKEQIKSYWSKILGISKDKIKTYFTEKKVSYPGACTVKYTSVLLKFLLLFILNASIYKQLTKSDSQSLLRGLLASEGSVVLKHKKLENVSFENLDIRLIELFTRCLDIVGIKWKNSYIKIFIQGLDNYLKMFRYELLNLNIFQYYKFLYGFYNYKNMQDFITIKNLNKVEFVTKDLLSKYKLKASQNVIRKLRSMADNGFLNIEGLGTKKTPYIFIVTKKTNEIFSHIERIEKMISDLELQCPELKQYVISLEKRQFNNKFELKNRDFKFFDGLEIGLWYSLKDIQSIIGCSRGHATTVMPWLVRKGFAEKRKDGNKMLYKIIKTI